MLDLHKRSVRNTQFSDTKSCNIPPVQENATHMIQTQDRHVHQNCQLYNTKFVSFCALPLFELYTM